MKEEKWTALHLKFFWPSEFLLALVLILLHSIPYVEAMLHSSLLLGFKRCQLSREGTSACCSCCLLKKRYCDCRWRGGAGCPGCSLYKRHMHSSHVCLCVTGFQSWMGSDAHTFTFGWVRKLLHYSITAFLCRGCKKLNKKRNTK